MIDFQRLKNCQISSELKDDDLHFWFNYKQQKFLHNIDTLYYTVKLSNDFTKDTEDTAVLSFVNEYQRRKITKTYQDLLSVSIPGIQNINFLPHMGQGFYNIWFEIPEYYDFIFASNVPMGKNGISVTPEIMVQIRSYALWMYGATKVFEKSFEVIKAICNYYGFEIIEVKENRFDFCWHTNYIQNPDAYFSPLRLAKSQVSNFRRARVEFEYKPNDEVEYDYITHGKRNDKIFLRIYLKSKEVTQKGYKPWFLMTWLLNGLISRYDFYIYEECYKESSWSKLDEMRLKFYLEYGTDKGIKAKISDYLEGRVSMSTKRISELADYLTPRVTIIINIEYQVTRKAFKTFPIYPYSKDNFKKYGVASRMYDIFDNRFPITNYLTDSVFRLVETKEECMDMNKSRRPYTSFWKKLRSTKQVDVKIPKKQLDFTRIYNKKLNAEVMKRRVLNSAVVYGIYKKGINSDDVLQDCADALMRLNDNDIERMKAYKIKKSKKFNECELSGLIDEPSSETAYYVVNEDGEVINKYNNKNDESQ